MGTAVLGTADRLLTGAGVDAVGRSAASATTRCTCTSTAAARALLRSPGRFQRQDVTAHLGGGDGKLGDAAGGRCQCVRISCQDTAGWDADGGRVRTQSQWVQNFGRDSARRPALVC